MKKKILVNSKKKKNTKNAKIIRSKFCSSLELTCTITRNSFIRFTSFIVDSFFEIFKFNLKKFCLNLISNRFHKFRHAFCSSRKNIKQRHNRDINSSCMTCRKFEIDDDEISKFVFVFRNIITSNLSIFDQMYRLFHNAKLMKLLCFKFSFWKIFEKAIWIDRNKLNNQNQHVQFNEFNQIIYIDVVVVVFLFCLSTYVRRKTI